MAEVALWGQRIDQLLKRQLLMRLGLGHHLADLGEQLAEGGLFIHLHAHDLGIDEETDQPFEVLAVAPGIGHADADVVLATVARQHHGQGAEQHHEQGLAIGLSQAAQRAGQRGRQVGAHHRALVAGLRRAWVVQRQVEQRLFIAQLGLPVTQLPLALTGFQPGTLPDGVVGVLDRQRFRVRRLPGQQCVIERHERLHHQLARPAIADDVVHAHREHVFGGTHTQQLDPQQRVCEQVEGATQFVAHCAIEVVRLDLDALRTTGDCSSTC